MTNNQIQYAKLQEDRRHNIVSEAETARHNKRSEDVGFYTGGAAYAGVAESTRHNQEQERINWYTAENLGALQGAQTAKTTSEIGVESGKLEETERHNLATEQKDLQSLEETRRHNQQTESQKDEEITISKWNTGINAVDTAGEVWRDGTQGLFNLYKVGGVAGVKSLFK